MKTFLVTIFLGLFVVTAQAAEVGVRIRFGLTDNANTVWDGTVTVSPGRVTLLSGWRFEQTDAVEGTTGWKASTRPAATLGLRSNAQKKAGQLPPKAGGQPKGGGQPKAGGFPKGGGAGGALADNGVILSLAGVTEDSLVEVKTEKGNFNFKLSDIPFGKMVGKLDGAVEVERVAASRPLTSVRTDEDYPGAAIAPDGTIYVTYVAFTPGIDRDERSRTWDKEPGDLSFLAKAPGGDQLWLLPVKGGQPGQAIAVTGAGADIYKDTLAVDGDGRVWIFWSENKAYKPYPKNPQANFDIWARSFKDGKLSEPQKISDSKENDVWPVAATDAKGRVWIAWQGAQNDVFRILVRHQDGNGWSKEIAASTQTRNCWAPAIAAASAKAGGKVAIAWDTYEKGDYDVWLREFDADGKAGEPRPAANSEDYEARPALTYDQAGALWIAWEQSGPSWGKDWGALVRDKGIGLYRDRQIGLAILKSGQWFEPEGSLAGALPGAQVRRRINNQRVPAIEPQGESRKVGQEAEAQRNLPHNNIARLICDNAGRVWLFARGRQNDFRSQIGSLWFNHAAYYDGQSWTGPILVPHSDNLLYNTPAVVPLPEGGVLVAHSSDHRQDRHIERRGSNPLGILDGQDPFDNDLYLSRIELPAKPHAASLKPAANAPVAHPQPAAYTVKERADVERIRAYRANIAGKDLRISRGEFHRHTEISGDGGNDGPLEDMWRYAIDVAAMDWLGCGDHDNGGHREYPWWLTQKTTDAFHLPGSFDPFFTYERSVSYPEGHRNIIFTQRGVRTLPRLPRSDRDAPGHAPDTQMLYKYLHLFNGICASHTSATSMGTDWRDNDPVVEPFVEIYQGCRQNYERPGAPRCPTADDAIGGWEPKGFVNLALLKGYRLAFQSSSDHSSTHISYTLVFAENNSRDAVHKAMQQRHVYGSTDNIIADFRSKSGGKEHMMGDEFTSSEPPKVSIKLIGTGPFAKVTLVKDDVEIPLDTPEKSEVNATWTDPKPEAGKTSYYYVRGEQKDGELVWASPMWIKYQPKN